MEAAVQAGLTNPTCTSQEVKWPVPPAKTVVDVTLISELDIEVHKYGVKSMYRQFL